MPSIAVDQRKLATAPRRGRQASMASALVGLGLLVAVVLGLKDFQIWDSVREFVNNDPWLYLSIPWSDLIQNPWWIRTGVALPSLLVEEFTPLSLEQSFGLYAATVVLLTARLVNLTLEDLHGPSSTRSVLITSFLVAFGCLMNGRICFAFLGSAILYRSHLLWQLGRMTTWRVMWMNLIAMILMTVSTGAFYVGTAAIGLVTLLGLRDPRPGPLRGKWSLSIVGAALPSAILIIHQGMLFNEKLARWHEGDYMMMLYHGPLKVAEKLIPSIDPDMAILAMGAAGLLGFCGWLLFFNTRPVAKVYMTSTLLVGVACGAFGWSTMLTNLPGMLLVTVAYLTPAPRTATFGTRSATTRLRAA